MKKFRQTVDLFKKYGDQYQFDYLLLAAQGYQESGLNQSVQKPRGRYRHNAGHACNGARTRCG